jgi:hypothetical protein
MKVEDIAVHVGEPDLPYEDLGWVSVTVGAGTVLSKAPTIKDANLRLREKLVGLGANAVVHVTYKRGISAGSWKALTAQGRAARLHSVHRGRSVWAPPDPSTRAEGPT